MTGLSAYGRVEQQVNAVLQISGGFNQKNNGAFQGKSPSLNGCALPAISL
jgi:hypothetical protein